jgi:hypothetical protein
LQLCELLQNLPEGKAEILMLLLRDRTSPELTKPPTLKEVFSPLWPKAKSKPLSSVIKKQWTLNSLQTAIALPTRIKSDRTPNTFKKAIAN